MSSQNQSEERRIGEAISDLKHSETISILNRLMIDLKQAINNGVHIPNVSIERLNKDGSMIRRDIEHCKIENRLKK